MNGHVKVENKESTSNLEPTTILVITEEEFHTYATDTTLHGINHLVKKSSYLRR